MKLPEARSFANPPARILVLEPGRAEHHYWADLWEYRELFWILAWRDLAVRYKQTLIGVVWAVIRPLLTLVIFTTVFGRMAKLPSDGAAPYSLTVLSGLLPWTLFSTILGEASVSLVSNSNLITKVYFPRVIVPAATIVVALVDFGVTLGLLFLLMLWFPFMPSWRIVSLPLFILLAVTASMGPSLLMTAMTVRYRDFRYIIPFVLQFGLYASPVGFTSANIPDQWRLLYSLNPMVGIIDGFRWCLLGEQAPLYWPGFAVSLGVCALFLWLGVASFRKTERTFADLI